MTANQFSYLEEVIKVAVNAAEVIFNGDGRGEEKKSMLKIM